MNNAFSFRIFHNFRDYTEKNMFGNKNFGQNGANFAKIFTIRYDSIIKLAYYPYLGNISKKYY
ncbi:hypothetical protein BLM37_03010 [Candidatus Gracilibacteria bacterium GN02-873]|nr:hypothetical protein BLM37_03010 [Candidatus Gracilibacteria bacterium GN02-873]